MNDTVIDYENCLEHATLLPRCVPGMLLEAYANRDCLHYADKYVMKQLKTVFRGTLRFAPFASVSRVFEAMGLSSETDPTGTWSSFINSKLEGNDSVK